MKNPLRVLIEETLQELNVDPTAENVQVMIDFIKDVLGWVEAKSKGKKRI